MPRAHNPAKISTHTATYHVISCYKIKQNLYRALKINIFLMFFFFFHIGYNNCSLFTTHSVTPQTQKHTTSDGRVDINFCLFLPAKLWLIPADKWIIWMLVKLQTNISDTMSMTKKFQKDKPTRFFIRWHRFIRNDFFHSQQLATRWLNLHHSSVLQ